MVHFSKDRIQAIYVAGLVPGTYSTESYGLLLASHIKELNKVLYFIPLSSKNMFQPSLPEFFQKKRRGGHMSTVIRTYSAGAYSFGPMTDPGSILFPKHHPPQPSHSHILVVVR